MGLYSDAKAALAKEQGKQIEPPKPEGLYAQAKAEIAKEQAKKYTPEELVALAKAASEAAAQAETSIKKLQLAAAKAEETVASLPQFGNLVLALKSVADEFSGLKISIDILTEETRRKNLTEQAAASKLVDSLTESLYNSE